MDSRYYAPDNLLVAESPPLQPVRLSLEPLEDLTWEPLTFEEHKYSCSGQFPKADSSLQVLYSYPELDLNTQYGITNPSDEHEYEHDTSYDRGVFLAKSGQPLSG